MTYSPETTASPIQDAAPAAPADPQTTHYPRPSRARFIPLAIALVLLVAGGTLALTRALDQQHPTDASVGPDATEAATNAPLVGVSAALLDTIEYDEEAASYIYTHVEVKTVALDGNIAATQATPEFDPTFTLEVERFAGTIPLVSTDSQTSRRDFEYSYDVVQTYTGLPDNDVERIPATLTATIPGTDAEGGSRTATLSRASVTFAPTASDSESIPTSYTATVVYRGLAGTTVDESVTVTATYRGPVELVGAAFEQESTSRDNVLVCALLAAIVGAGGIILWPLLAPPLFCGALLYRITAEGRERRIKRLYPARSGNETIFTLPARIDFAAAPAEGTRYRLDIKPRIVARDGDLVVRWLDRLLAKAPMTDTLMLP